MQLIHVSITRESMRLAVMSLLTRCEVLTLSKGLEPGLYCPLERTLSRFL